MTDSEVKRYYVVANPDGTAGLEQSQNGNLVCASDFDRVQRERDEALDFQASALDKLAICRNELTKSQKQLDAARAEVARLARDAGRYRWLKEDAADETSTHYILFDVVPESWDEQIDLRISAALAPAKEVGK